MSLPRSLAAAFPGRGARRFAFIDLLVGRAIFLVTNQEIMSSLFHVPERTHSGLLLMSSLARRYGEEGTFLTLQEVAQQMGISLAYLEEIANALKRAELIEGRKGPGGGYRLSRSPDEITAEMIFAAIEGPVHLVECQKTSLECPAQTHCTSQGFWKVLQKTIQQTLRQTTLQEILHL